MPTPLEPPDSAPPAAAPAAVETGPRDAGGLKKVLASTAATTALVTVVSYASPRAHAATLVAVVFLAATWMLVLRTEDAPNIHAHGLSMGGLLEPARLEWRRIARDAVSSIAWALAAMAVTFPLFWLGYLVYEHPGAHFALRFPRSAFDEVVGQFVVIAVPEEAFFRGYLQTSLDRVWAPRWRLAGARVGPGWVLTAAIFAVGHLLTDLRPARLAVFFPALLFGWLRQRTGGVGASVAFHAACNLFSATLARSYELL